MGERGHNVNRGRPDVTFLSLGIAAVLALIAAGLSFVFLDALPVWTHIGIFAGVLAVGLPFGRRLIEI